MYTREQRKEFLRAAVKALQAAGEKELATQVEIQLWRLELGDRQE